MQYDVMMAFQDDNSLKSELTPALRVLKSLGGSIVFSDDEGEQFILARRSDIEKTKMPVADNSNIIDDVNEEIALSLIQEEEQSGARVKFEPIRGDLPPELQE